MQTSIRPRFGKLIAGGFLLGGLLGVADAAPIPPAEKLLPDDTIFLLAIPDFAQAREIYKKTPQAQFWNDPAMTAFREKFMEKLKTEYIKPLERDLGVQFSDYTDLPQGQFTFAVTQNGWQGKDDQRPALLFLLDTKSKSTQLKKNLADLKKKWVNAGKTIRVEKIRNVEFSVVQISSNDLPKLLKKSLPGVVTEEISDGKDAKKAAPKYEVFVGQLDSLLIVGDAVNAIEKALSHLTGGTAPTLSEQAGFQANYNSVFRDAPLYAWLNAKVLTDIFSKPPAEQNDPSAQGAFTEFNSQKLFTATGLSALKTIAASFRDSPEGSLVNVFLTAPESSRLGILKILAGEAKETVPPAFVPADVVKFQRWRVDGQKTWTTLEKMFNEISPQIMGGISLMLDTAAASAKEKDPDFDLKKNFIGNLGDDIVSYEKKPHGSTSAELNSPPSLFMISSPHPEQLAAALKSVLIILPTQQGATPTDREFLGRKIYTIPLPGMPMGEAKTVQSRSLNYAASGGYVALSTDVSILEEFLRSSENPPKAFRETVGLTTAAQKVVGTGTSWFGFENQSEAMRVTFEVLNNDSNALSSTKFVPVPGTFSTANDEKGVKDWFDVSLLPNFDKVAKYFYFTVYGVSANVDGLSVKFFAPVPPQLKKGTDAPEK